MCGTESPFVDASFIETPKNFTELMGVLSVFSVPYEAGDHVYESEGLGVKITGKSNFIVFHKDIKL